MFIVAVVHLHTNCDRHMVSIYFIFLFVLCSLQKKIIEFKSESIYNNILQIGLHHLDNKKRLENSADLCCVVSRVLCTQRNNPSFSCTNKSLLNMIVDVTDQSGIRLGLACLMPTQASRRVVRSVQKGSRS